MSLSLNDDMDHVNCSANTSIKHIMTFTATRTYDAASLTIEANDVLSTNDAAMHEWTAQRHIQYKIIANIFNSHNGAVLFVRVAFVQLTPFLKTLMDCDVWEQWPPLEAAVDFERKAKRITEQVIRVKRKPGRYAIQSTILTQCMVRNAYALETQPANFMRLFDGYQGVRDWALRRGFMFKIECRKLSSENGDDIDGVVLGVLVWPREKKAM